MFHFQVQVHFREAGKAPSKAVKSVRAWKRPSAALKAGEKEAGAIERYFEGVHLIRVQVVGPAGVVHSMAA